MLLVALARMLETLLVLVMKFKAGMLPAIGPALVVMGREGALAETRGDGCAVRAPVATRRARAHGVRLAPAAALAAVGAIRVVRWRRERSVRRVAFAAGVRSLGRAGER